MQTDRRNTTFENIILDALRVGGTRDFPPFHIFQAAIGDLAGGYPKERKFLTKTADSKYYGLCVKAVDSIREGHSVNIDPASQYLQKEYMVERDWADYITQAMVGAFAAFKGKRARFTQTGTGRNPDGGSAAANRDPKPGFIDSGAGTETVSFDPGEEQNNNVGTQQKMPAKKPARKNLKFVIIGGILLLAIVTAVVVHFAGGTDDAGDTETTATTVTQGYSEEEDSGYADDDVIESDPVDTEILYVSEPDGYANIRDGRGTEYDVVGSLNNGEAVVVCDLKDGWYKIYEGAYAGYYISRKTLTSSYVEAGGTKTMYVSEPDGYANIRDGRGTEYNIVGSLNNGDAVVVWNLKDGWYEIYEGAYKGGYISEKTLTP